MPDEVTVNAENVWIAHKQITTNDPKILPYLTVLETNKYDNLLVGACDLGGSYWNGSLWLFRNPEDAPDLHKSIAGLEMDVGATDAKFLPCGKKLVVADYSGSMVLVDIQNAASDCPFYFTRTSEFKGHDDYVTSISVDKSGTVMLSGSMDSSVILWDIEGSLRRQLFTHASAVTSISTKPNEIMLFATSSRDGSALFWDGRIERPASMIKSYSTPLSSVDWLDSNIIAISDWSGYLSLVDIRSRESIASERLSTKHGIRKIRANLLSQALACAVDDLSLHIFTCHGGVLHDVYQSKKHIDFISGLAWSDINTLYSSSWDTQVLKHSVPDLSLIPQDLTNEKKGKLSELDPYHVIDKSEWW